MATLSDLLADPNAAIEVVVSISYLSSSNTESIEWVCQGSQGQGWIDPSSGPVAGYIPPLLATDLTISQHIEPLSPSEAFGAYTQLELINDLIGTVYEGRYDLWHEVSIDNRPINIYLVGRLSNGTRVDLEDVLSTPLFALLGVDFPEVGDGQVILNVRDDSHSLDLPIQPQTYSGPCPLFPGTASTSGSITYGNNYNLTGSFSLCGWVRLTDATVANQYPIKKDGATNGYWFEVGNVLRMTVLGLGTPAIVSAANLMHSGYWHFVSFALNTTGTQMEIGLDGVSVASGSYVSGTPAASTVAFVMGWGLKGNMAKWTVYNAYQSISTMYNNARLPVDTTSSSLIAYLVSSTDPGVGSTTYDRDSGSSITGSMGVGVTWDTASWHLAAIVGNYRPYVLGTVPRVPVSWIDPVQKVGEVSYGGAALISEVQSNHNALVGPSPAVGAVWSQNHPAGTFTVTSGSLSGTYSATVTANNFWNSALSIVSNSTVLATINSVNGSMTMAIQYTPSKSYSSNVYIMGWQTGASAGSIILRFATSGGANRLEAFCINDAGTVTVCSTTANLMEGTTYSLAVVRNMNQAGNTAGTGATLSIWVNGSQVGSVSISGVYSTTRTAFGIGCRPDTSTVQAEGRYDEPLVFSRALSQSNLQSLHLLPATGTESNLTYGWHCDDATGTSAASMLGGGVALTLTNVTWIGGRSSPSDLARKIYYLAGYGSADLDQTTWLSCLNSCSADCGWYVGSGESALDIARIILGGLGFVPYKIGTVIYIRRFIGITGIAESTYDVISTVREGDITPAGHDPAIWSWQVLYAHNNVKMDPANIAAALATSDPDRYNYGQMQDRVSIKSDYSIKVKADGSKGRFPNAVDKKRQTALLKQADADVEGLRLLLLHRYGADIKSIPLWVLAGSKRILHEAAFSGISELGMDRGNFVVIGLECTDDVATATIWRQARSTVVDARITDAEDYRVTDDGAVRVDG